MWMESGGGGGVSIHTVEYQMRQGIHSIEKTLPRAKYQNF